MCVQVYTTLVTFYAYSEPDWQQCTLFQNFTAERLLDSGYPGSYTITGRNSFTINDFATVRPKIIDLRTNKVGGLLNSSQSLSISSILHEILKY